MGKNKIIDILNESGINRIKHWMDNHDIACISACRWKIKDVTNGTNPNDVARYENAVETEKQKNNNDELPQDFGVELSKEENKQRTKELKAFLIAKGYGVTEISGSYIEGFGTKNPHEVGETSFFVVNLNDDPQFLDNIFKLSELFNQDSVLLKSKNEDAYLIGTNNAEWPGYGQKSDYKNFHILAGRFMSRVGNAAFSFANDNNLVMRKDKYDVRKGDADDYEHDFLYHYDHRPSFQTSKNDRIKANKKEDEQGNINNEDIKYKLSDKLTEKYHKFIDNYFLYIKEERCKGFALQNLYETARKTSKALKLVEEKNNKTLFAKYVEEVLKN